MGAAHGQMSESARRRRRERRDRERGEQTELQTGQQTDSYAMRNRRDTGKRVGARGVQEGGGGGGGGGWRERNLKTFVFRGL